MLTEPEGGHLRGGRFAPDDLLGTLEAWMAGPLIENPYYLLPGVDGAAPAQSRPRKAAP
ncbi:hypothetical protein [Kutzneria sp. 744]|uniref:hypothetical protein n=1 Tax=Kutzneria sp. (strain 744) TaxID=345341 RepID=UPI0004AE139D|nr:hypothetical protein [Kutzneria sp. 744]